MARPRVYLAGPEVFRPDVANVFAIMKEICAAAGFEGVVPLDADLGPVDNLAPQEVALKIYLGNIDLIRSCDAVIANIEPFRGLNMDSGTSFEIGYAAALGKPTYAWRSDRIDYLKRVQSAMDTTPDAETPNRWRDAEGMEVENFGLVDNLMPVGAASLEPDQPIYESFAAAVAEVRITMRRLP